MPFCRDCGTELTPETWAGSRMKCSDRICKSCFSEGVKRRDLALKLEVLAYYGNGRLACVKCGCADHRCLLADHINGNGNEQRRGDKKTRGKAIYRWLKRHGFPVGYQTLCFNCNRIKMYENHEFKGHPSSPQSLSSNPVQSQPTAPTLPMLPLETKCKQSRVGLDKGLKFLQVATEQAPRTS